MQTHCLTTGEWYAVFMAGACFGALMVAFMQLLWRIFLSFVSSKS